MDEETQARVTSSLEIARTAAGKVWKTAPHVLDKEELTSIAYEGLCQAAGRWLAYCERHGYSPDRDDYWAVYAWRRCFGAIMDTLRQRDHASRALRAKFKRLKEAGLEEGISYEDLAEVTGISQKNVASTVHLMYNKPGYLEDEEPEELYTVGTIESNNVASSIMEKVVEHISGLSPFQQYVLVQRYYYGQQLNKIRDALGCQESTVSQAHITGVLSVLAAAQASAS